MKKRTKFLAMLLIAALLAGNLSGYAIAPQFMNVKAEESSVPTIPTTYGTELFVETFNGTTHSLSGTNSGCTQTMQDGYLLLESANNDKQFYRDAILAQTSTETAAMINVKFCVDDINTKFRFPVYFGAVRATDSMTVQDGAIYRNNDETAKVTLSAGTWHTLTIIADYASNTAYYYMDGVYFSQFTDATMISQELQFYGIRLFRHKNDSSLACKIRFDEITAYGVTLGAEATPEPTLAPTEAPTLEPGATEAPTAEPTLAPTEAPTPEPTPEPTATPVPTQAPAIPADRGSYLFKETFEDDTLETDMLFAGAGWNKTVKDGYILCEKVADKQAYFDVYFGEIRNGNKAIYQTDFYMEDINSPFRIMLFTEGTGSGVLDTIYVYEGKLIFGGHEEVLAADTWYTVTAVFDYENGTVHYYLNGTCFGHTIDAALISMGSQFARVRVNFADKINGINGNLTKNFKVRYDNVKVYEDAAPAPTPTPSPAPTLMPDQGSYVFEERFENDTYGEGFKVTGSGWTRSIMSGYTLFEKANEAQAYYDVTTNPIQNGKKAVYAMDFYMEDVNSPFRVMLFTTGSDTGTLDTINIYDGNIVWRGGKTPLEQNKWYTLSAFFNYEEGTVDYYLDDVHFGHVKDSMLISMTSQLTKVRVNFADKIDGITGNFQKNFAVRYDNVLVYEDAVGTAQPTPTPAPTIPPEAEGTLYFQETFSKETFKNYKALKLTSGWEKTVKDGYILCERKDGKSAYMEGNFGAITKGNTAVFQMDFYMEDLNSPFRIMVYTVGEGKVEVLDSVYVVDGRLTRSLKKIQLEADTWYTFTAVFNYNNGTVDYFLNDEHFAQVVKPEKISLNHQFCKFRLNYADKLNGVTGYLEKNFKVRLDNVRVYEADLGAPRLGGSGYPPLPKDVAAPLEGERYMINEKFASDKINKAVKFVGKGWTETLHADGYMHLQKAENVQAYVDVKAPAISMGNSVVYKMDFYMEYQDSAFRVMFFTKNGETEEYIDALYVYNGGVIYGVNKFDLEPNEWHTITAYVNYDKSTIYYYLDDEMVGFKTDVDNISMDHQLSKVRINYSDKVGKLKNNFKRHFQIRLDNIKLYNGNAAEPYYPYVGNKTLINEKFDTDGSTIKPRSDKGWLRTIEQEKKTGNNFMQLLKKDNKAEQGIWRVIGLDQTDSEVIVFEWDLKIMARATGFTTFFCSNDDQVSLGKLKVEEGDLVCEDFTQKLELNQWYRISAIIDYNYSEVAYYLDGVKIATIVHDPSEFGVDNKMTFFRFQRTNKEILSDAFKVGIDNIRCYEGNTLRDEVDEVKKEIILTGESIFDSDKLIAQALNGYTAVHKRSSIVFANGKKTMLPTLITEDGKVQTKELAEILQVTLPADTAEEMEVEAFFTDVLKMQVATADANKNSGMVIAGSRKYPIPSDEVALQDLNDFLFYYNPSAKELEELLESTGMKNVHPRIQATAADFDKLRDIYNNKSDAYIVSWIDQMIAFADKQLNMELLKYGLTDGTRMASVGENLQDRMYSLGMAYQMTGDQKYVDRAYLELENVCCKFPDWNPYHTLDMSTHAVGVAIGYDWMYDGFTDTQRRRIEEGVYDNGYYEAVALFQGEISSMRDNTYDTENWNTVINGGYIALTLAFADAYPEISFMLLEHNIRAWAEMFGGFAPLGAWHEGPDYWRYLMGYLSKGMGSLDTALKTDFRLSTVEGLSTTGEYMIHMNGEEGIFPYGDGMAKGIYGSSLMWCARQFNKPGLTNAVLDKTNGAVGRISEIATCTLWYNPDIEYSKTEFPLDAVFPKDEVATMHRSHGEKNSAFVALHAGDNHASHGHLDTGSFVFESDGVRWITELGKGDYNQDGYFDEAGGRRWKIFRVRAEGHSTLVINPKEEYDQDLYAVSKIDFMESKPRGTVVYTDMTDAYDEYNASSVLRGLNFTDDRQSLVLRDEVTLLPKEGGNDVYWYLLSEAKIYEKNIAADGMSGSITLEYDGKRMVLDYTTNMPAEFSAEIARPIFEKTQYLDLENARQIALVFKGIEGELEITAKMTPETVALPSELSEYVMPVKEWTVPDGEITAVPTIESMKVDGKDFVMEGKVDTFYYLEGDMKAVPTVEVTSQEGVEIEIQYGATIDDVTYIYLRDKNKAEAVSKYLLNFKQAVPQTTFTGKTVVPVIGVETSEEPQGSSHGYYAKNLIDGDASTMWTGSTAENYAIIETYDVYPISGVAITFLNGVGTRQYDFVVYTSEDGYNFTEVLTARSEVVSGAYEHFDFPEQIKAKYVKVQVNSNTDEVMWTAIGEIVPYLEGEYDIASVASSNASGAGKTVAIIGAAVCVVAAAAITTTLLIRKKKKGNVAK